VFIVWCYEHDTKDLMVEQTPADSPFNLMTEMGAVAETSFSEY
jgi:hypothetical protein